MSYKTNGLLLYTLDETVQSSVDTRKSLKKLLHRIFRKKSETNSTRLLGKRRELSDTVELELSVSYPFSLLEALRGKEEELTRFSISHRIRAQRRQTRRVLLPRGQHSSPSTFWYSSITRWPRY
jgi:hypothetical protein